MTRPRTVSPTDVKRAASDEKSAEILAQPLDSPQACITVLAQTNTEVASFMHVWAAEAGELGRLEKVYERMKRSARSAVTGSNAEERAHLAQAAIEEAEPHLLPNIETLTERVTQREIQFKALDRIAMTTQSILTAHRESGRWEQHGPQGKTFGRRAA